jgi:hypothetical protein
MARLRQTPLIRWLAGETRLAHVARSITPLGFALALVLGSVLLLGMNRTGARSGAQALAASEKSSAPLGVARADAHVETLWQGKDLEVNLALTQTQNDCQAPLNGGYCLRYSVVVDEQGMLEGYGVIPASDVIRTPGVIMLRVDTSKVPGFTHTMGSGQLIMVTWKAASGKSGGQQRATVQGGIGAFAIPSMGTNGVGTKGASVIATMIVH